MHGAMRIPELSQRDRFVRRAVIHKGAWAVAGEAGLAHVASPDTPGIDVTLLWTAESEAHRWADVLAANPRVEFITLNTLIAEVLPALSELKRRVGPDWSADPIESEIDPKDLIASLRHEGVEAFLHSMRQHNAVWILEDADGPALLVASSQSNRLMLPCWASREEAEARRKGPWYEMSPVEIPLYNFVDTTLPWLDDQNWLVTPGYAPDGDAMELTPHELMRRIEPMPLARSA